LLTSAEQVRWSSLSCLADPETQAFAHMSKYNPFRPGGVAGPTMFAGRVAELLEIERVLTQARHNNGQHFLFHGERGIGKSSLMLYAKLMAAGKISSLRSGRFQFVVIETELSPTTTGLEIVKKLAKGLRTELGRIEKFKDLLAKVWDIAKRVEAAGVKYNERETADEFELLDDLVEAVVDAAAHIRPEYDGIVFLIDEADKAPLSANLGAFLKIFTERLSKRQCDCVCIGLAGVTGLIPKLRASHESSPRIFNVMLLEPLQPDERKQVVRRGIEEANTKNQQRAAISDAGVEAISDLSEGFPHFIQQFAYCAFEVDRDNVISDSDVYVGAVLENGALDQLGEKYFQEMYYDKIGSDEYRSILHHMATVGDGTDWVSKASIREATNLKETTLANAINALKDREIILPKPGEKGVYRLPSRSFAAWLRARVKGKDEVRAE
jgi:hypothetical protein